MVVGSVKRTHSELQPGTKDCTLPGAPRTSVATGVVWTLPGLSCSVPANAGLSDLAPAPWSPFLPTHSLLSLVVRPPEEDLGSLLICKKPASP